MDKDPRAREEAGLPLRLAMKRRRRQIDDGGSDEQRSDNVDDNGGDGGEAAVSSDPRLLAFDLSPRHELSMAGYTWSARAKAKAEDIRFGRLTHCVWWDEKDDEPFPLLRLDPPTGVYRFMVDEDICERLHTFLSDASNYSQDGFLKMAGTTWPGYGNYPYVHAPAGQVAELQERRTVRVHTLHEVNKLLKHVPAIADLVRAVRAVLGLRQPGVNSAAQLNAGKRIVAMHFLAQDSTKQAVFSWHDDAEDIGHAGRRPSWDMTTVIVNLSQQLSGMRVWGCSPVVYDCRGSAVAFPGASLHESLPMLSVPEGVVVRKVALFFN